MMTIVGFLATIYAATFIFAAALHLGARIPLGFGVLDEPRRPIAVLVEGSAGLALAFAAFGVIARKDWAWAAAVWAHGLALAGVAWGMAAVAAGRGPHTVLNDIYHRAIVVLLAAGLILLLTPLGRKSFAATRRRR